MAVPTRPYGSWPSPIDAALAASLDGRPEYLGAVGPEVWWTEPRPREAGRRTLVRRRIADEGPEITELPAPWNVRSRVTEYGGLPWAGAERESGGPLLVFAHFADQRLYAYEPDAPGGPGPRPSPPCPPWAADCAGPTPCCAEVRSGACWRSSPGPPPPMCAASWPPYRSTDRPPKTGPQCGS